MSPTSRLGALTRTRPAAPQGGPRSAAALLVGAPGAGKSSVLEKLATLLEIEGVAFGALEVEQLGWGSPPLDGEPWRAQLRAVLELQRAAGRRLFLLAATPESSAELAALVEAIAVDVVVRVLLSAPVEVAAARVAAREPDDWPGTPGLVAHARELAVTLERLEGIDARIVTVDRHAAEVAAEVRDVLRARGLLADDR